MHQMVATRRVGWSKSSWQNQLVQDPNWGGPLRKCWKIGSKLVKIPKIKTQNCQILEYPVRARLHSKILNFNFNFFFKF